MTVIATASNPRFSVSRVDIDRGGPTYTNGHAAGSAGAPTRRRLVLHHRRRRAGPILAWQDPTSCSQLAHFIGVRGLATTHSSTHRRLRVARRRAVSLVEVPALAISSTECRGARAGEPVWYLVPDGVVQYIAKRGLYREWSTRRERTLTVTATDKATELARSPPGRRPKSWRTTSSSSTCAINSSSPTAS